MSTGVVKFFDQERGWGFIIPDDGGADVYVKWHYCRDNYVPQDGDIVQFTLKEFPDGRCAARNVDLAE